MSEPDDNPNDDCTGSKIEFTNQDRLHLLQVQAKLAISDADEVSEVVGWPERARTTDPAEFRFDIGLTPYPWQVAALARLKAKGYRGIVKAVTGSGKTPFALMALGELFRANHDLRVSVIVPRIVLMDQWYEEIGRFSNINENLVGRRGGRNRDSFADGKRIMILVRNSAVQREFLARDVEKAQIGTQHFIVADECHGLTGDTVSKVFRAEYGEGALGLSATPEQSDGQSDNDDGRLPDSDANDDLNAPDPDGNLGNLANDIGDIVYEFTLKDALAQGIMPPFRIINYHVELTRPEQSKYEDYNRRIRDLSDRLRGYDGFDPRGGDRFRKLQSIAAGSGDGGHASLARQVLHFETQRNLTVYRAENRRRCFTDIIERENTSGSQIIAFHESINLVNSLYRQLLSEGYPALVYHSGLTSESLKRQILKGFADRTVKILLSVKSLIEGYNVPATDVGVIVASTSSIRQRIQTMGRVLRRFPGKSHSTIYNIHVKDTGDEGIFRRFDWGEFVGEDNVKYFAWHGAGQSELLPGPPHLPKPKEADIDLDSLREGDEYPGEYDGTEYSVDANRRVFRIGSDGKRQHAAASSTIADAVISVKGEAGKFKVTPVKHAVIVLVKDRGDGWRTLYVTTLNKGFRWTDGHVEADYAEFEYKQRHGGSIWQVRSSREIRKIIGTAAEQIVDAIKELEKNGGHRPSTIYVKLPDRKEVYIKDQDGALIPLCALGESFE